MIDFRYHIVSLVAVFLALAIGIVIGGFTLRGEVGQSLTAQVTQLRTEKNNLRQQAGQASDSLKKRDTFITTVLPSVVNGTLTGQEIAVVVLPGADPTLLQSTRKTIAEAGGAVTSTTYLSKDWISPGFASGKDITGMAASLHITATDTSKSRLPSTVLGKALIAGSPKGSKNPAAGVLPQLVKDQAISVQPQHPQGAGAVVVLWSGMSSAEDGATTIERWTDSVAALGASADAVVGVSAGAVGGDPSTPDDLVSNLRRTPDSAARMSTVDDGALGMGQAAMALAVQAELQGQSGQYGIDHDATSVLPKSQNAGS